MRLEVERNFVEFGHIFIHSDVNYPLWHRLIKKHGLSLTPRISAEQPEEGATSSFAKDHRGVWGHLKVAISFLYSVLLLPIYVIYFIFFFIYWIHMCPRPIF